MSSNMTLEEMAEWLAHRASWRIRCPDKFPGIHCPHQSRKDCTTCILDDSTPAEITAKYEETRGRGERTESNG